MSVKGCVNQKLRCFIEGAERLFGPAATGVATTCPKRNPERRRTIMRQSLVQTCSLHVESEEHPLHERLHIPPKLVCTTSAHIVLVAVVEVIESTITMGTPLLSWLRDNSFQMIMFILAVDQAAYNGLAFKFLLCLQLLLLPSLNFFLWLEPCGLHQGVRALIAHCDRCDHQKLLRACSRSLRLSKNHDKICEVTPRMVEYKARYYRGPPPYLCPSVSAECSKLLLELFMMSEKQRTIRAEDPQAALDQSRRKFHLVAAMRLLNFTLLGDLFIHYCQGCCADAGEFKHKLSYHLVSLAEGGIDKWMPTRFTHIFGAPCYICPLQTLNFFGATAFAVAFKKNVEDAIETLRATKDREHDPLGDINWTSPYRTPR